jgi:hypothetical protein
MAISLKFFSKTSSFCRGLGFRITLTVSASPFGFALK